MHSLLSRNLKRTIFTALLIIAGMVAGIKAAEKANKELKETTYIKLFTEVYQIVKSKYVESISPRKLFEGAIQGMLSSLDPHSVLFTPDSFKEFKVETSGEFGGLGIRITKTKDGRLMIISPIEDTPAYEAGLKAGDVIVEIDGKPFTPNMTLEDAVKVMRGKPGTKIKIKVWRKGWIEPKEFVITRAIIKIKSVKYRILEDNIGYIRLTMFQKNSPEEFQKALQKLASKNIDGLIIDLRNNPGGLLDAAVTISDFFLKKGALIVYTKGRISESSKTYKSAMNPIFPAGLPLVILVNGGTASAAEILTGALRYNDRAIVVGEKTFGKGSVQTLYQLESNYAVKITTAKYYMPNNVCIDGKGIKPDIKVSLSKEDIETMKKEYKEVEEHPEKTEEIRKEQEKRMDNQLKRAVEVIREIKILRRVQKKAA